MTLRGDVVRVLSKRNKVKADVSAFPGMRLTPADYQFGKKLTKMVGVDPESTPGGVALFLMFAAKRASYVSQARDHPEALNEGARPSEVDALEKTAMQALTTYVAFVSANKSFFKSFATLYTKKMGQV